MPDNKEVVQSLYAAMARGDGGAIIGALSPDVEWNEAENFVYADRNPYRGPEAVGAGILGRLMSEWDGFSVHPQQLVAEGDTVVSLGRYQATYKGTGRPVDAQFVHVWTVRDGKVTRFQQYTDTAQFAKALAP